MKAIFSYFILLAYLTITYAKFSIISASDSICDSSGNGIIELTLDNSPTSSLSFELTLKSDLGNIQASCSSENLISKESNIISCTFDSPKVEIKYVLELTNEEDEIELSADSLEINIYPCITEKEAYKRLDIPISFRQVNSFDLSTLSFIFYGLTRTKLEKEYEVNINILIMNDTNYFSKLIETNCALSTNIKEFSNIAPVSFNCIISKENLPFEKTYNVKLISYGSNKPKVINVVKDITGLGLNEAKSLVESAPVSIKEGVSESEAEEIKTKLVNAGATVEFETKEKYSFSSIEIANSDFVAGFPANKYLMNPIKTKKAIEEGSLNDVSSSQSYPLLVDKPTINISLFGEEILIMNIPSVIKNINVDQSFIIKLKYPGGVILNCTVTEIGTDETIINCSIIGKILTQKIFIEQTIISFDGKELFVLPSFETTVINEEEIPSTLYESSTIIAEEEQENLNEEEEETNEELSEEYQSSIIKETSDLILDEYRDEPISKEEAEKRALLFISFRQINNFLFKEGVITFNFYGLTTQKIEKGNKKKLYANLIGINGIEENASKFICESQESVNPEIGKSLQVKYICELTGLNESEEYTSLKLNYSNDIAGIPKNNEILLNPYLTDEAIINNEIKDCSKDSSVPPTFDLYSIDKINCNKNGSFILKGKLSEEKSIVDIFTIPLTYPEGIYLSCTFEEKDIRCLIDKEIDDEIVIEQTNIIYENEELFNFKSIIHENLKCANGLFKRAEEKTNLDISFRQVSHIQRITNGFTFFFAAFANKDISVPYQISMNIIINSLDNKIEKLSNCSLKETIKNFDGLSQADFNCEIHLDSDENIPLENISISNKNYKIGGCSQMTKEELSPKLTDEEINNSINEISELGITVDYYESKNKNKKPPVFKIISFDLGNCETKGKIKIKGAFNEKIENEIIFDLSFSYPSSNIKCLVEKATKGEIIDIFCKIQKVRKFREFKSFIVEPKILKKNKKEILFIESVIFNSEQQYNCKSFNELKFKKAKIRKNSYFSFLQIARPSGFNKLFFLSLIKKNNTAQFETMKFPISSIIEKSRLRSLQETEEIDNIEVECNIGNKTNNAVTFECDNNSGKIPFKIDINNNNISGIPDDVLIETKPNPDFSKKESLELIDSLPNVKIVNITSKKCSITGTYEIKAKIINNKALDFNTKDNIIIPFSNPDSKGLCIINVDLDKINIGITCENIEAFSPTDIIISSQIVYDKDGITPLFKIDEDYTASTQFFCIISDKSLIESSEEYNTIRYYNKNSGNGISGGLIAVIVIIPIIAISIVGAIILLTKKQCFSNKHTDEKDNSNSIIQFTNNKLNIKNII